MQFRCYLQQAGPSSPDQLIKLAGLRGPCAAGKVLSAEEFKREWDKILARHGFRRSGGACDLPGGSQVGGGHPTHPVGHPQTSFVSSRLHSVAGIAAGEVSL